MIYDMLIHVAYNLSELEYFQYMNKLHMLWKLVSALEIKNQKGNFNFLLTILTLLSQNCEEKKQNKLKTCIFIGYSHIVKMI